MFTAEGPSLIPGQGAKILHVMCHGQKKQNIWKNTEILEVNLIQSQVVLVVKNPLRDMGAIPG